MHRQSEPKFIGVLGGLGAVATAQFFSLVVAFTDAQTEQDHVRLIIDNDPTVPDRSASISGSGPSAAPALVNAAKRLAAAGANLIVMPCNTAHFYAAEIAAAVSIPFASLISITLDDVAIRAPRAQKIGLLAAEGCIRAELYQQHARQRNIELLLPEAAAQQALIEAIYAIKKNGGDRATEQRVEATVRHLHDRGADVAVLACTELSATAAVCRKILPIVDSSAALARFVVRTGGARLGAWAEDA